MESFTAETLRSAEKRGEARRKNTNLSETPRLLGVSAVKLLIWNLD